MKAGTSPIKASDAPVSLSVVIMTLNEERHIGGVLASLSGLEAGEVLVLDSGSTDRTLQIARSAGAVVLEEAWKGYARQRASGQSQARGEWVLFLDADERVTPALSAEIRSAIGEEGYAGYKLKRRNYYLGRPLRCWWPDATGRLVRKGRGHWSGGHVHERLVFDGPVRTLREPLLHDAHRGVADQHSKQLRYAELVAREKLEQGRVFGWPMLLRPFGALVKLLLLKGGVFEGRRGWIFAISQSIYSMQKVLFLAEASLRREGQSSEFPLQSPEIGASDEQAGGEQKKP